MVFAAVVAFFAVGYSEFRDLETTNYDVSSSKIPQQFDGVKIVLLTDIHRTWFFSQERVRMLVERVNAMHPDIIVLGGDYVAGGQKYQASCFAELSKLKASLGVYAVLGNHDYYNDVDASTARKAIKAAGIPLLDNSAVWVEKGGKRIRLGGVADLQEGDPDYAPTLSGTTASDYVILVSHNPDYAEQLPKGRIDLVLSGHTHGGQVTFFGLWAPMTRSRYGQKFLAGKIKTDTTTVIVSRGIGAIVLPIRFFAEPEIVQITLRAATASTASSSVNTASAANGAR